MNIVDLNKLKFYQALTIILTILLIISNLMSVLTNGFSVWDRYAPKDTLVKKTPIFVLHVEPLVLEEDEALDILHKEFSLSFNVETSGGIYKIENDFKIDTLVITNEKYFYYEVDHPIELKGITIDKVLLDSNFPNISGLIKIDCFFLLDPWEVGFLSKDKEVEIAYFYFYFPYSFEGEKHIEKFKIPVILKSGDN